MKLTRRALVIGALRTGIKVRRKLRKVLLALRIPSFNYAEAVGEYKAITDDAQKQEVLDLLQEFIDTNGASISNTYTKAQITAGLEVGLIAMYLTVFAPKEGIIMPLLVTGVILTALSIVSTRFITSPRSKVWTEVVENYALRVFRYLNKNDRRFLKLAHRANLNRVVLLRNRRVAHFATWFLAVPGLVLAMMSWTPIGTLIALVFALLALWAIRRLTRPLPSSREIPHGIGLNELEKLLCQA